MEEMRSAVRSERLFLARLIYADMRRRLGANVKDIAKSLCKSRRNIYYYHHQVRVQLDFNKDFTRLYRAVEAEIIPQLEYSPLAFSTIRCKKESTNELTIGDLFTDTLPTSEDEDNETF